MNLRKFFGCRPRFGDSVTGYLDFGVSFTGQVIEDDSKNEHFPRFTVLGAIHIDNMWRGEIVEDGRTFTVHPDKVSLL